MIHSKTADLQQLIGETPNQHREIKNLYSVFINSFLNSDFSRSHVEFSKTNGKNLFKCIR